MFRTLLTIALSLPLVALSPVFADASEHEDTAAQDALAETAKQLNNPISSVWNITVQNNYTLLGGDATEELRGSWVTNFQPVLPVPLTPTFNLISRPILPIVSIPVPVGNDVTERKQGLGDFAFQAFVSPNTSSGFVWGVGPLFVFPTATSDELSSKKWSAGPALVGLSVGKNSVVGALLTHTQSFAGSSSRPDVSVTALQYFATRMLPNQWQVGVGSPTIVYDWSAAGPDQWTVPVGLSVGKTIRVGAMPFQMNFETSYAVVHPETFGQRWNFRFVVKPVLPRLIQEPLFGS